MAKSIRNRQVANMIQQALGEIFLRETPRLFGRVMITVTAVRISDNLGLAKVYLSFMLHESKAAILESIEQRKGEIRGLLGSRVGKKLRRVPDLQFYIDDSVAEAMQISQLLDELALPTDEV
ncbi:MAG: 30S ribosome-binding factor RbfA [Bacteroidota bacterium]